MSGETKEPTTTTTATLEDGGDGGGEGGLIINTAPSLASRLNQRADLLRRIFSFHAKNPSLDYIDLRSSSKLFHKALPPPPLWTSFPHPTHTTLQSLLDRFEALYSKDKSKVLPKIYIEEGEHSGRTVHVNIPTTIIGAGREKTILLFGLSIKGNKSDGIVEIENLKIKGAGGFGLYAEDGMKVITRGITIEDCQNKGVCAVYADISCDDLQVIGCGQSGVYASDNATITLSGQDTSIQGNGTNGDYIGEYGLKASVSANIHLVSPLTKEQISTNNGGSGNWGGYGTIKQVDNDGVVFQILYEGEEGDYMY